MHQRACNALAMLSLSPLLLATPALAAAAVANARLMLHRPEFTMQDPTRMPWLNSDDVKVPVTLGVMSRCPDALLCESVFDKVLAQVGDKVAMSLTFIGKANTSEPDFGVTCMHGPYECAGNVQELCASKHLEQKQWWSYLKCQNFYGRDEIGTPEVALKCADAAKFDWVESGVGQCAGVDGTGKGEEGVKLLQESVKMSSDMGITKSCTVLINNRQVCVHDGTWKECDDGHAPEDFVRQINDEYDKLNASPETSTDLD